MLARRRDLYRIGLAAACLIGAMLACCPTPAPEAVTVMITSPGDGGTVVVGQAVMIDSAITAAAGVDRVDLSVDGEVVRHDTPPEANPTEFRVSQLWTPTSEGQATITVVAYDVNDASSRATITLQVVASGGAGNFEDLYRALTLGKADAVLAASIFHYGTYSIGDTKKYLTEKGIPIRM